jgi:hypothetical protein
MDSRKERIGEHLAQYPPSWALGTLGAVPEDPLDRLEWLHRASEIGAYRELYGYDHPDEPIGPEPAGDSPEKRAAWHSALAALGPLDGIDLRAMSDGSLLDMRAIYAAETAWAPQHVGRELRAIRTSADDANLAGIRAQAEERIARQRGQSEVAARHDVLARSYAAMEAFYREHETELEQTIQARRDWERATQQSRQVAVAADAELRRRHPGQRFEPLRSAEPFVTQEQRKQLVLTPGAQSYQTPEWITQLAAERRAVRERLAEHDGLGSLGKQPGSAGAREAWPVWAERDGDAILKPPRPDIRPALAVVQLAADRQLEPS